MKERVVNYRGHVESRKKFMYVDSEMLVQLSGMNSRGTLPNNVKVKCVLITKGFYKGVMIICIRYDWTGASFQVLFLWLSYVVNLAVLKGNRLTGMVQ